MMAACLRSDGVRLASAIASRAQWMARVEAGAHFLERRRERSWIQAARRFSGAMGMSSARGRRPVIPASMLVACSVRVWPRPEVADWPRMEMGWFIWCWRGWCNPFRVVVRRSYSRG